MRSLKLFGVVALLTALAAQSISAQAPPTAKPEELLASFQTTFDQGKFDLAAEYLKAFLATNPSDQQLLDIEKKYGTGAFQNLQAVPKWSDDAAADKAARATVKELTTRVRAAADKILRDPARIQKFVRNLGETYEEKLYAINELRRTGDVVVPYMVAAYGSGATDELKAGILEAITRLDAPSVAGWLAALDGLTPEQRYGVFSAILARRDVLALPNFAETDFTPYLWYLAALPQEEAPALRQLVFSILAQLNASDPRKKDPVDELVRLARTFYEHTAHFRTATKQDSGGSGVILWAWDPAKETLVRNDNVPVSRAEEHYGLRYARWALERKPDDGTAKRLLLALATERAVEKGNFGELSRTAPAVYHLLADAPTPLLSDLLNEALARKRSALALGITQVLADRADKSVAVVPPSPGSKPRPPLLVRCLDYPDVRVQIAAANGLLRAPVSLTPEVRARIMTVLKAAASGDTGAAPDSKGQALIVDPNRGRNDSLAALLRSLGYNVEQFVHGRDLLRRIGDSSDFDLVLVDRHVAHPQLNDFLSQLRSDLKSGGVPIAVVASPDKTLRPTLDGLVLRLALLIAATETDSVEIPTPFVPRIDPRADLSEANLKNRAENLVERDNKLGIAAQTRIARLKRVLENSDLLITSAQRSLLNLRIEQVTWAVLALQYPISRESSPLTAAYLAEFTRRLAIQPPIPPYNAIPTDGLMQRVERLHVDVDQQAAVKAKFDALRAAIDVDALGIDIGVTRDLELEAAVARNIKTHPGVGIIPVPFSRVGFEDDLKKVFADNGRQPRDTAEKLAAARTAVGWLQRMATGEVPGFDVKAAEAELRAALASDDLAHPAIEAVVKINTGDAQQALMNVALHVLRPAHIRIHAADATIRHIQTHGKMLPQTQIAALVPLVGTEQNPEVRVKLAVVKGLVAHDAGNFITNLKQFTPQEPAAPAKAPAPMPAGDAPAEAPKAGN